MRGRIGAVIEVAGVSAYMLGAAAYLRLRGRLRPDVPLPVLGVVAGRVALGRLVGPRSGPLAPIESVGGRAYSARLPQLLGEPSDAESRSRLVVLEDGRPLGPGHTAHAEIGERGAGRYSHWRSHVIFSASDDTDPRANGRRYEYAIHD